MELDRQCRTDCPFKRDADRFRKALYACERSLSYRIGNSVPSSRSNTNAPPQNKYNLVARLSGVRALINSSLDEKQKDARDILMEAYMEECNEHPVEGSIEFRRLKALQSVLGIEKLETGQEVNVDDWECCICCDKIDPESAMPGKTCNHLLHADCAKQYAQKSASRLGDSRSFLSVMITVMILMAILWKTCGPRVKL